MTDDGGPKLLRMVRYKSLLQDAERLRNPLAQDRFESLARTIHMGDPTHAQEALLDWLDEETRTLERSPTSTNHARLRLWALFLEFESKILGRQGVMATELGYYSQNVAPDFGKVLHEFADWANASTLTRMFNEGNEIVVQGHVGTGKTHLAVKFLELLLQLKAPRYVVISNISGLHDPTRASADRLHIVSRLSEILRIWANLPAETRIVLAIDEPESNLRAGASKAVVIFEQFRYMIRKLGMAKLEIWHNQNEQYKGLREDQSQQIHRIMKDDKSSFTLTQERQGETVTRRIDAVPDLQALVFATRGMASITVDVNMQAIIQHIAKLSVIDEMKAAVREALEKPRFYLKEYQTSDEDPSKAAKEDEEAARIQLVVDQVLAAPDAYRGDRAKYSAEKIRLAFKLTLRQAQFVVEECKRRTHASGA